MIRWKFRPTSNFATRFYGLAKSISSGLKFVTANVAQKTVVSSGFLFRARKHFNTVTVDAIELPGRLVSSVRDFREFVPEGFTAIAGYSKSGAEGITSQVSPNLDQMDPSTSPFDFVELGASELGRGPHHNFGEALPEGAYYLSNGLAVEVDGGVAFISYFSDVRPAYTDPYSGPAVTVEKVWLVVTVKWSGVGPPRSVTFSEDELIARTGYGFYPRLRASGGARVRLSVFDNSCFFHNDKMQIAIGGLRPEGDNTTTGAGVLLTVDFSPEGGPEYEATTIDESYLPSEVHSDTELMPEPGVTPTPYRLNGFDLPSVFAFTGADGADVVVASYRFRSFKNVWPYNNPYLPSIRRLTCQVLVTIRDGSTSVEVDYIDSASGLDSPLVKLEPDRAILQHLRDIFFLDAMGGLVRHRRMAVFTRPALDLEINQAAMSTLDVHPDIALMVTQGARTITQKQSVLGFGPQQDGSRFSWATSSRFFPLCSTMVGEAELWGTYIENQTHMSVLVSITASGVSRLPAASLPLTFNITTYQKEVLDEEGGVLMGMGQVATVFLIEDSIPLIAFKKGRFGGMSFKDADTYSQYGTFYLASQTSTVRYGRIFS